MLSEETPAAFPHETERQPGVCPHLRGAGVVLVVDDGMIRRRTVSKTYKVGVFIGSLRRDSLSRKYAKVLAGLAPAGLGFETIEIGDVPFYNEDLDQGQPPASWSRLREKVAALDAVLFVTPEYNRSVPAVLKNALDVASRPYGKSAWDGKPGAVVSLSPGGVGGFGANHHLRQSLVCLNVPTLQQPEAYIGGAAALLDASGTLINEGTHGFLSGFMRKFADWIAANTKG